MVKRRSARLLLTGLGLESSRSSLVVDRLSIGGLGPPAYLASWAIDKSRKREGVEVMATLGEGQGERRAGATSALKR
jgi:hypothetical protein